MCFALVLAGIASAVSATGLDDERYPWDQRASECTVVTPQPPCFTEDWPSFDTATSRVVLLYKLERFSLLERALKELARSDKLFSSGKSFASVPYAAFRTLMPAPGTRLEEQSRIGRWKNAFPNSYFVVFASARYAYGNAWNARGAGNSGSVSPESWQLYESRLREAVAILNRAPKALSAVRLWDGLMLAIVLDLNSRDYDVQKIFETTVKRWPREFSFYENLQNRLIPKWGGSWGAVDAFIAFWSEQQRATEGSSLYARLYIAMLTQGAPNETLMKWEKMRISLEDLSNRYPDPLFKNMYPSFACFARDKSTYQKAMQALKQQEIVPQFWLNGNSYEACTLWSEK